MVVTNLRIKFKPDGIVRIYGDFVITFNPLLEGTTYPLSKIEHGYYLGTIYFIIMCNFF